MRGRPNTADEGEELSRSFLIERHIATAMGAAHWHDHIEINVLLNGNMTYLFNGRQEKVEVGHPALFWAAIPHQTIAVTPQAHLVCIYLPLVDFLAMPVDKASRQAIMQGAFMTQRSLEKIMPVLAAQWNEEWLSGNASRRQLVVEEVKLAVRRLVLDEVDARRPSTQAAPGKNPSMRHAQTLTDLINIRFAEPLTLTSLSTLANVHPTTANRAFRAVLGISAMEYLTRYRLARAMQRLAETDDPIVEVALESGFGSNTRFYDVFKQRTGTTPRQFRLAVRF